MDSPLTFGLTLTAVGISIVFLVLTTIALIVAALRRLDDRWKNRERREEREAFGKEPTIDATTLVLLAAAAATVIQGRFRIRRVRRLSGGASPASVWSLQGRSVLQGSHVIVRKAIHPAQTEKKR